MDTTQLTHISLCAGYGGIDLGLRRVLPDLRTIAYSEIEEYACGLLAARMESGHLDPAPIWSDLKTFPFRDFHGCVDILSGGYPCQPFSAAGKRRGTDDPRHLWPFIADGIQLCQPRLCFFENVEGHISLGLPNVIEDLAGLGYRTAWGIFSAAECGAPHQRKRVFILAYRDSEGLPRHWGFEQFRLSSRRQSAEGCASEGGGSRSQGILWPSRPGEPQFGWEPPRVVGIVSPKLANFCTRDTQSGGNTSPAGRESVGQWRESKNPMLDRGPSVCRGNQENEQKQGDQGVADAVRNGRSKAERDAATMGDEERSEEGGKSESRPIAPSSDGGSSMGNAASKHPRRPLRIRPRSSRHRGAGGSSDTGRGQVEPALGGDADGPAGGLDYADLSIACHNRTDELRLLGNGVVPATAERAFRTLYARLLP